MGLISKDLCKCTICMYGTHAQNALDDPTRSSSAAGLDIQPVLPLLWLNSNIWQTYLKFVNNFISKYCIFYSYFRPAQ